MEVIELEFSIEWMRNNQDSFIQQFNGFFDKYRFEAGWVITSRVRVGFLTLIATREEY